jgi:hypothetical protein
MTMRKLEADAGLRRMPDQALLRIMAISRRARHLRTIAQDRS